jgi:HAD superfamily hydrolase (TIGR01509 family)
MSSPYSAVFFDLGGTLFSYRDVGRWTFGALLASAKKLGVEAEGREIGRAYRDASHSANESYIDRPYYLHRDLFRDTFRLFAERLGGEASQDYLDFSVAALRDALVGNMVLRGDCLDTLRTLKAKGLYLSIVSNIDDDYLMPMVADSGLDAVLDHWTSSEEARSCKPDSGFFRLALQKAGCSAEQVLFVGDSPTHDIQGAKDIGMTAALIVEGDSKPPLQSSRESVPPDHEIRALSDLIALVE